MDNKPTYDPEDIESLLLNKEFEDLYPEERAFVLRHLESADEYRSMRMGLLLVQQSRDHDSPVKPDASIKKALMTQFEQQGPRRAIWLNSFFVAGAPGSNRQTVLAIAAGVAILLTVSIWWFASQSDQPLQIAENNPTEKPVKPAEEVVIALPQDTPAVEGPVIAEVDSEPQEPVAVPPPVKEDPPVTPTTGPYDGKAMVAEGEVQEPEQLPADDDAAEDVAVAETTSSGVTNDIVVAEVPGRSLADDAELEALLYTVL